MLPKLNRDELQLKQMNDFYSRVCIELSKANRSSEFVLKIGLLCEHEIEVGDPRAAFWKDVLPIALTILEKDNSIIENGRKSDIGRVYAQEIINNILNDSFPSSTSALTSFVSMFK